MREQAQKIARMYLVVFYFSGLLALFQEDVPITVFIWVFLVPALSYFLLDTFWGSIYTAVVIFASLLIYSYQFYAQEAFFNTAFLSNILVCMGVNWLLAHEYYAHNQKAQKMLIDIASIDNLTGLYNRTPLEQIFTQQLHASKESNTALGLILLDVDWFKKINDNYGHAAGDKVLCLLSELMRMSVNSKDSIFRLGGEEFCILLPFSNLNKTIATAEKLRACIASEFKNYGRERISITISCGVIVCEDTSKPLSSQLKLADTLLYQAKEAGRNQVAFNQK